MNSWYDVWSREKPGLNYYGKKKGSVRMYAEASMLAVISDDELHSSAKVWSAARKTAGLMGDLEWYLDIKAREAPTYTEMAQRERVKFGVDFGQIMINEIRKGNVKG